MRSLLVFIFLLSSLAVSAIEATLSHSVFFLPDPLFKEKMNPYMEVYWQVNPKTVQYKTNEQKGIIARIQMEVKITNDTGGVVKEDRYIFQTIPRSSAAELEALNILELKRYFVVPGRLKFSLKMTDLNDTTNKYFVLDTVTVAPYSKKPFYGGVELIDTVYESNVRTPFRKHGKQYIPLCGTFYDDYRDVLTYYTELYNLQNIDKLDFPIFQTIFLSKKAGAGPLDTLKKLDTIYNDTTSFFTGNFNIGGVPSGNYYLNFSLGNKTHTTLASSSILIQRMKKYRPSPIQHQVVEEPKSDTGIEKVTFVDLNKTFMAKFNLGQIKAILKMLLPVSDPAGMQTIENFLKKPDDLYMRYFVYNYFLALDSKKPEKAWKEYSDKVKEVNKLFSKGGKQGYETARGFMYLRYGAPSEMLIQAHEKGALPYEIWQYNNLKDMAGKMMSNAVILFYKSSDMDFDYRLLHTNISGEIHNSGWRSFLYVASDGGGSNTDSKAELYIGNR